MEDYKLCREKNTLSFVTCMHTSDLHPFLLSSKLLLISINDESECADVEKKLIQIFPWKVRLMIVCIRFVNNPFEQEQNKKKMWKFLSFSLLFLHIPKEIIGMDGVVKYFFSKLPCSESRLVHNLKKDTYCFNNIFLQASAEACFLIYHIFFRMKKNDNKMIWEIFLQGENK